MDRSLTKTGFSTARTRRAGLLAVLALASATACGGQTGGFEGTPVSHPDGWSVDMPDGWTSAEVGSALILTRELAHGSGYPTLRVTKVGPGGAPPPEGRRVASEFLEGTYVVLPWQSRQGQGQTVRADLRGAGIRFEAEASLLRGSEAADRNLLREEILPALGSVRPSGGG